VHEPLNRLIRLPFFDSIRAVYGVGQSPEAVQLQLERASRIIEWLRADGGDDRLGGPGNRATRASSSVSTAYAVAVLREHPPWIVSASPRKLSSFNSNR